MAVVRLFFAVFHCVSCAAMVTRLYCEILLDIMLTAVARLLHSKANKTNWGILV